MACIYGLYDKRGALRYIGKANDLGKRLKDHLRETRRRTPLYDWLHKNGAPEMRVLEENCADWREAERRLIAEARQRGDRLLNIADGGDEPHCPQEVRAHNGRANAAAVHGDPARKRLWSLKRTLGESLTKGYVSNATRVKMRQAAEQHPHLFGEWTDIPDRALRASP
jgi:predicted GIY-YIG superfamily endonuclease